MSRSKGTKETQAASSGEAWLEELESTVRQAGETLQALRREKAELTEQVKTLEARVGELEAETSGDEGTGAEADEAAAAWREERQEIRDRVEKLTERLEGLLEEE